MATVSFEFFPPKEDIGIEYLQENSAKLLCCTPDFFSVTNGAAGSRKEGTLETIQLLQEHTAIPTFPHLSCIDSTKDEIEILMNEYLSMGVERIVALRGDKSSEKEMVGEFNFAVDLVDFIRKNISTNLHITVAAYPEMHPEAKHLQHDLANFKAKIDAGADSAITQYFYNPDAYFHFLDRCAAQQIIVPITPGIMPIYNIEKVLKFSSYCGAEIPRWILKQFAAYADCVESMKKFSFDIVFNLCERLLQFGAPGLHFYSLNQANTCIQLCEALGLTQK